MEKSPAYQPGMMPEPHPAPSTGQAPATSNPPGPVPTTSQPVPTIHVNESPQVPAYEPQMPQPHHPNHEPSMPEPQVQHAPTNEAPVAVAQDTQHPTKTGDHEVQDARGLGVETQQPTKQEAMQMGGPKTLQNSQGLPLDGNGEREWNHKLFGCCDQAGVCMLGCCCPCIVYGQNHSRVEAIRSTGQPHPQGGETCGTQAIISCLVWYVSGCGWVFDFMLRDDLRKRYHIKGSAGKDCAVTWCCGPCGQVQVRREIEDEEHAITHGLV